ncbi:hypothetical protein KUDE01_001924, partial [Dissostichus eleginoides]
TPALKGTLKLGIAPPKENLSLLSRVPGLALALRKKRDGIAQGDNQRALPRNSCPSLGEGASEAWVEAVPYGSARRHVITISLNTGQSKHPSGNMARSTPSPPSFSSRKSNQAGSVCKLQS